MDQARITEIKQEWAAEATRRDANAPPAHAADLGGIPSARYASEVFYALEQQYLWPKTWLLAGTADELPGIGNFKSFDHSFAPIVLVRDKQSTIRAYFNICRHRGGALVSDPCGKISAFACRYHCWTYGLDGKLKFVPDEFDFPYLDKAGSNLIELRCETLGGLIFVNADPAAPPLQEFLTPINEEFADMNLANRRLFHKTTYDVACNWKALMDVFEEGYHISTVHPNTINQYLDSGVGTRRCYPNGHGYAYVMKRTGPQAEEAALFDRMGVIDDPAHEITRTAARAYNLFPNIIIPFAQMQFPVLAFWPQGVDRTLMEVYFLGLEGYADPDSPACQQSIALFDYITKEDLANLAHLQRSFRAGVVERFQPGYAERLIHNHQQFLDRFIGPERIPEALRVKQIPVEQL